MITTTVQQPQSNTAEDKKEIIISLEDKISQLLSDYQVYIPLIPNEVAVLLLKIQSKYLHHHSCLCTSRFRHTLHQLEEDNHQKLDKLCNQLQQLTVDNYQEIKNEEEERIFYNQFLPTIFDLESLPSVYIKGQPEAPQAEGLNSSSADHQPISDADHLHQSLESILARLVSDYRAIFAIETECGAFHKNDEDRSNHPHHSSAVDHERRKRHEEEDSCPEEMKLMKVAYGELSLDCCSCSVQAAKDSAVCAVVASSPSPCGLESPIKSPLIKTPLDKDHHINRYYSLLRSQHKKSSHNSTRDPNHPHRYGHWHQSQPLTLQQISHASKSPTRMGLVEGMPRGSHAFCFSPTQLALSPPAMGLGHGGIFQFNTSPGSPGCGSGLTTFVAQRKRKDRRDFSPEKIQDIKFSRSSSELLDDEVRLEGGGTRREHDLEVDPIRRSKSFTAVSALKMPPGHEDGEGGQNGVSPMPISLSKRRTCTFYVSDDDLSNSAKTDHEECSSLTLSPPVASTEDSNCSLVCQFDRDFMLYAKPAALRRPLKNARSRKKGRPKSGNRAGQSDAVGSHERLAAKEDTDEPDFRGARGVAVILAEESMESNNLSSPSTVSLSSSSIIHSGEEDGGGGGGGGGGDGCDNNDDDDDTTLRQNQPPSDQAVGQPEFSVEKGQTVDVSHHLLVDAYSRCSPVVSWMPAQIALRRESQSSFSSEAEEDEETATRHFRMIHSQEHLDPSHISISDDECPRRMKLKQLNKQVKSVKKKIEELEEEFERKQSYRPSQADKWKNEKFRKLISDLSRLKSQIRSCKDSDFRLVEDSLKGAGGGVSTTSEDESPLDEDFKASSPAGQVSMDDIQSCLANLEQKLSVQRKVSGRMMSLAAMSSDQLSDEKRDTKAVLVHLEQRFGRPVNEDMKRMTKDIYDHYQNIKRHIRRSSAAVRLKENLELQTIPEDLEIPLTLASPQHRINIEVTTTTSGPEQKVTESRPNVKLMSNLSPPPPAPPPPPPPPLLPHHPVEDDNERPLKLIDENLHALSRFELLEVQRRAKEQKKLYRRSLKEKEELYLREQGLRRISKEERVRIDEINYSLYKQAKAQLKLIEALLSKGRQ